MPLLRPIIAICSLMATAVACSPSGQAPVLDPMTDQIAQVGEDFVLVITATDQDGDDLFYSYTSDGPDLGQRATITRRPDGAGVFRWRPVADDVRIWNFDFQVTDGDNTDVLTIQIDVRSAIGENSAPIFREPLGTGTTLDLSQADCIDVDIVIEDPDSASVQLGQEEPVIAGATLDQLDGLTALWHWCPTAAQIEQDDRYTLSLSADDATNPKTLKLYLLVLRTPPKPDCPGAAPVVAHTETDRQTLLPIAIDADISDDLGLKREPLLYYSTTAPSTPPNLGAMTQVTMELVAGDMNDGTWRATVPNPVADLAEGASRTLYYVVVADDDDDATGDCDHLTQAPATGSYSLTVTNPGGDGGLGLCERCGNDIQCGGSDDLCVRIGAAADAYCLEACGAGSACPDGYTCSPGAVTSVDGVALRQCVPDEGSCEPVEVCEDDTFEDNDSPSQAAANPVMSPGTLDDLVSCPTATSDDEDWYRITIAADSQVELELEGGSTSDLDLSLHDADGALIADSTSFESIESIAECVTPGTYFVRVFAFTPAENTYSLTYARTAMSCSAGECEDDGNEEDDDLTEANLADVSSGPFVETDAAICADDDDWYEIEASTGDDVIVDLTFDNAIGDLDLHFHDEDGEDLTPCSERAPDTCSAEQGQGTESNEHYEHTVGSGCSMSPCTFYVVVHGWDGAENSYDLEIAIE
jgi:hypothetical protein